MEKKKNDLIGLRYYIDFKLIPSLFIKEPGGMLNMFEDDKMVEFFIKVFNDMYEGHRVFDESDFKITKYEDPYAFVYYVKLPDEHNGSMVWCDAYGFAFARTDTGWSCQFFTVETSAENTHMLCGVSYKMNHLNFGNAFKTDKENAEKMMELIHPQPHHVAL